MMKAYQVTFQIGSPLLTPWQADTLFGHLCWALARLDGENALTDLLKRYRMGDPPLLVSDGFPPDAFPRPLVPPPLPGTVGSLPEQIAAARQGKAARESKWLNASQFAQVLRGEPLEQVTGSEADAQKQDGDRAFSTLHNQINRATGTTSGVDGDGLDEEAAGELYALKGDLVRERVVYVRVAEDIGFDWQRLLLSLQDTGFGKRKSVGYGAVTGCRIEEHAGFGEPGDANGFVSLSAFVPGTNDPTNGYWQADVKYGKLGEERAAITNPFKRPLVRLLAGAVFHTPTAPASFYGRLVDGIAPGASDAAQYAFAFAVPLHFPSTQ